MLKIKSFSMTGIRGVKGLLEIPLDKKSALFYGDNGSGKSSISDAFEWFYFDKVDHLSSEEIGRNILDAMKNYSLGTGVSPAFKIEYTEPTLNAERNITSKKDSLVSAISNKTPDFNAYLEASRRENLILRYRSLGEFILSSKAEKLGKLSEIIGFGEVTRTRAALKKALNDLAKETKNRNFESQISIQQANLIKYFSQNVTSESQFLDCVNNLLASLKGIPKVAAFKELDQILELIKKPKDAKIISLQAILTKISDWAQIVLPRLNDLERQYEKFFEQFQKVVANVENLKKMVLEKLLSSGKEVLDGGLFEDQVCPLCLQPKSREELKIELAKRLQDLAKIKEEKTNLESIRKSLHKFLNQEIMVAKQFETDILLDAVEFQSLRALITTVVDSLEKYLPQLEADLTSGKSEIGNGGSLKVDRVIFPNIQQNCSQLAGTLQGAKEDAGISEIHIKIALAKEAFLQIMRLEKERAKISNQISSMNLIYSEFVKTQKEGLNSFLTGFSKELNEFYEFMNPDEKATAIQLINIEKDEELLGLTLQVKFWGNEITPPQKFLSESHLNCIGIAFFLASVKAFNIRNRFFILDDVISSFDSNHRMRFADLLIEKFSDYQIFLFTHERQWFDYLNNKIKNKGWLIKTIKWTTAKETHVEESIQNLRERIEFKVANNIEDDLGNDVRKFLENRLKEIAQSCQVRVNFLFNDRNEDRMANELLSELKGKINSSSQLKGNPIFDRLISSLFIGNKDSHDSEYTPSMGDLKAFWQNVETCIKLFLCSSCQKFISLDNYDEVSKQIRCKCGALKYDWKK